MRVKLVRADPSSLAINHGLALSPPPRPDRQRQSRGGIGMLRVLCVSRGHLCRSPMAAAVLRQMALEEGLGLVVDSAGAGALTVGSPPDRFATLVTERRGYRMGPVRGRRLKAYDYEIFDLILAMDDATWAG
ncbi:MAG: hypothetical protein AAFV49_14030, partial [Pseudomonadota bacterium]